MNIQLEVFFSFSFSYFQSGKMQVSGTIYVTQKKILSVHCFLAFWSQKVKKLSPKFYKYTQTTNKGNCNTVDSNLYCTQFTPLPISPH